MPATHDHTALPEGLPAPADDGAADHLAGMRVPSVELPSTDGGTVDLGSLPGRVAVFAFPRTGRPDVPPLVPDWNMIPGARGCTAQTCAFRDVAAAFADRRCGLFGLSTQDSGYQREMVARLHVPFPVLSDAELRLAGALRLPTMQVAGLTLLRRLGWIAEDGLILTHFYPVFPPDGHARLMLDWLRAHPPGR